MNSTIVFFIVAIVVDVLLWQAIKRSNPGMLWFLVSKMPLSRTWGLVLKLGLFAIAFVLILVTSQPAFALIILLAWVPQLASSALYNRVKDDPEQLVDYYSHFIERNPTDANNYHLRAYAYKKAGRPDKALVDLRTIADLIDEGKAKKVRQAYQPLSIHNRAYLQFRIIASYWQMGEYEYCISEAEAALAAPHLPATNQALFHINLAASHMELGRIQVAIDELKQAQSLLFDTMSVEASSENVAINSMIQYNQMLAYYRLGDSGEALERWQRLHNREKDYANPEWIKREFKWSPTWHIDAMLDMNKRLKAMS